MSGIWILFLSLIELAVVIIVAYYIFYRVSINKSLHSDNPKKRVSPKNFIIGVMAISLIISVGFSVYKIAGDLIERNTEHKYFNYFYEDRRGAAFDALFDDKDLATQSGYFLYVRQENGFEICELSDGRDRYSLLPNNIIRIRYTDELPTLAEGEHLDFSFMFLYRNDEQKDGKFVGQGAEGEYKQIYLSYNCYGKYSIKITAELRIRTNKIDNIKPFAEMLYEFSIVQS